MNIRLGYCSLVPDITSAGRDTPRRKSTEKVTFFVPVGYFVKTELEWALARLRTATVTLREAAKDSVPATSADALGAPAWMSSFQQYAELFLTYAYEFRERMITLLALLTKRNRDEYINAGGYEKRQDALRDLALKSEAHRRFAVIFTVLDQHLCAPVGERGEMTHAASIRFLLILDNDQFVEPEDLLIQLGPDESKYAEIRDVLQKQLVRFAEAREEEFAYIEKNASQLLDVLDQLIPDDE